MAGMKLKNGADLCGFELRRFTIQNDSSDPTDLKVGRKYFNNGGGTAHLRERIYVGDKTITTDGWRDAAYMDDIKRLEGIIGSLDGNVGDNLLGLAEQLNAVQAKVDAFLEGDVDADAVLENLNELKQFLDTYSGDVTLSQVLNDINEEVAKKADKATTLGGYGITDAVERKDYVSLEDIKATEKFLMGYCNPDGGWKTYSAGIVSKVHDNGFALQGVGNALYFRGVTSSSWDDKWHAILHEDNYSNFLDSVYLKQSGGTITGGFGSFNIMRDGEKPSSIRFVNTSTNLGAIGFNTLSIPCIWDGSGTNERQLLHEGNYESIVGDKFLKLTGGKITGALYIEGGYDSKLILNNTDADTNYNQILFQQDGSLYGVLGTTTGGVLHWNYYPILNSSNFGSYVLPLSGGTMTGGIKWSSTTLDSTNAQKESGLQLFSFMDKAVSPNGNSTYWSTLSAVTEYVGFQISSHGSKTSYMHPVFRKMYDDGTWGDWKTLAFTDSDITGNAASATKLQTARTLWGQSFDGTADINGDIRLPNYKALQSYTVGGTLRNLVVLNTADNLDIGDANYDTNLIGTKLIFKTGSWKTSMVINSSGNVTIGARDLASTNYKLHVDGKLRAQLINIEGGNEINGVGNDGSAAALCLNWSSAGNVILAKGGGSVCIGTTWDAAKLHIDAGASREALALNSTHANGALMKFLQSGTAKGILGYSPVFNASFLVGEADRGLFIHDKGNVTIGLYTNVNDTYGLYVADTLGVSSRVLIGGATDDGTTALQVGGNAIFGSSGVKVRINVGNIGIYGSDTYQRVIGGYTSDASKVLGGLNVYVASDALQLMWLGTNSERWFSADARYSTLEADWRLYAKAGLTIPTGQTLKIGDATLSWDSVNNALKVDKNFYSTEEVSAGGIGSGTTSGGGGGTNNTKAFDIPIGTESMTLAHNLGTKDVIVAIYEISDSYQQILADVIINNISEVTIMFGEATEVAHRVVIMG